MALLQSIRFETEDITYVEAGSDVRSGTRLYDSGVVGTVHLLLNGAELVAENRFPATFELSSTVRELHRMLATVTNGSSVRNQPFRCVCGDFGCTGISWEMVPDDGIVLRMEDLIGSSLPSQAYRTELDILRGALLELAETLIATLHTVDEAVGDTTHMLARIIKIYISESDTPLDA